MSESFLYSIGHSNKTIEELISELRLYGIQYLIDVRSMPYSKYHPHFSEIGYQSDWCHQVWLYGRCDWWTTTE